ncbi:MAG: SUMF1/EgtB/PvdO family nonheme iron enzyme [Myxococcota bacterium]
MAATLGLGGWGLGGCADDAPPGQSAFGQGEGDGSWDHPRLVDGLPFRHEGNTRDAISSEIGFYAPCAPDISEEGPEIVYRVEVVEAGFLSARIADGPGVDVDVHLLAADPDDPSLAPDPERCVTRAHIEAGAPVQPGAYYIVVDTWTDDSFAGAYTLDIDLVTEAANACHRSSISCDGRLAPFVNLDPVEAPGDPGCLPGMVRVENFCVDRYEAMVIARVSDDTWEPVSPFAPPDVGADLVALSVAGAVPQGHINQRAADRACAGAGKRLCSGDEWQRACKGASNTVYPYGNAREWGRCNDDRDCHPATQTFESFGDHVYANLGHACISQLPEGLAVTGAYADCRTEEGIHDMMGNLHEWTSAPSGIFRGGYFVDTYRNGNGCNYATDAHGTFYADYSTGFRCCADAID